MTIVILLNMNTRFKQHTLVFAIPMMLNTETEQVSIVAFLCIQLCQFEQIYSKIDINNTTCIIYKRNSYV